MLAANAPSYFSRLVEFHRTPAPPSMIDVAHLHWIARWLDLGSFVRSLPPGVPVVWTVHDMSPLAGGCFTDFGCGEFGNGCRRCPLLKWPCKYWWAHDEVCRREAILRGRRAAFVANSKSTAMLVKRSQVARGHRIEVIPPGFDFANMPECDKSTAKAKWGLAADTFVLGFVAASLTDENKGIGRFQAVAKEVARHVPNTRALLVGDGPAPELVPSVKTGLLGKDAEMHDAYSAMDALVVTSKMESFGQVSVEAQARGTPVWAFAVGGMPETLQNGKTGQLTEFGDISGLAEGIIKAKRENRLTAMGFEASRFSRETFDHFRAASSYLSLYQKLKTNHDSLATTD